MRRATILLLASILLAPALAGRSTFAQGSARPAQNDPELEARLAAIEKTLDEKRKELGIPGAALAIVKDDKVVYLKGLGLRDVAGNRPVTPDTLFAIGSSTKAFTAMAVAMAADDGRLSLDDSPKKFLPFFKLQDPDADAKITIRDLLCHRSGLNRTDIAWYSGVLTRDEIIQVAARAKPTAKLGEKWQYQNVMFLAAGEIAARAEHTTFERLIGERILKPLGMKTTTLSVAQMKKSKDFALGYDYNFATKETRNLPTRDLSAIAPAGAINSSAREMAEWVRLMLGGGVYKGKRLVSEAGFAEIVRPQMKVGGTVDYGLGWFVRDWNGHKVLEHGGNIDGFNAQVALMPDRHVGFVLLTNVSGSPLGQLAMNEVWTGLVGDPNARVVETGEATMEPKAEAGVYAFPEAGFDVKVDVVDGKLMLTVPGQPTYPLESVAGRRYRLGAPAPAGFFVTFRPAKDKPSATELYLEQPQGNYVLQRKMVDAPAADAGALGDLVGRYADKDQKGTVEIANLNGSVSLVVPGQPPYPLVKKSDDVFSLGGLSAEYVVTVRRASDGKVIGFAIKQPNGTFDFTRSADAKPEITVEELSSRVIKALGGEANLRRHTSSVTRVEFDFVHQGVQGRGTVYAKAPALAGTDTTLMALGKTLGTVRSWFDGHAGGQHVSFANPETFSGKRLDDAKISADFYEPLRWKELYASVVFRGKQKVGDDECYVVEKTPAAGNPVVDFYSTNSFLLVRRDTIEWSETTNTGFPEMTLFKDFRVVGGLVIPFETISSTTANGDVVTKVRDVTFDVAIPDAVFASR
jgi:CubicO group peptidase (beta-lactamase class C family)